MSDEAVCRTAPATPGLSNIPYQSWPEEKLQYIFIFQLNVNHSSSTGQRPALPPDPPVFPGRKRGPWPVSASLPPGPPAPPDLLLKCIF